MEENRIEAGIREWSGHSKRLSDLFGDSITEYPNIKKVQLSHFRDVAKRQLPDISKEEKTMLRIGRVIIPKPSEPVKPTTSQLTIQEPVRRNVHSEVEAKREIRPARTLEKKERVKHDLLPKNKSRQGKGIKR
jgi:hypothetical protein